MIEIRTICDVCGTDQMMRGILDVMRTPSKTWNVRYTAPLPEDWTINTGLILCPNCFAELSAGRLVLSTATKVPPRRIDSADTLAENPEADIM